MTKKTTSWLLPLKLLLSQGIFWSLILGHTTQPEFSWVVAALASTAFFFSEVGSWLATDYYVHRRYRGENEKPKTLTDSMQPPQLVLKGAWGSYLIAFLFALLVSFSLVEKGYVIMVLAFAGFFFGYYDLAPPVEWSRFWWGAFITSIPILWIPALASHYVSGVAIGFLPVLSLTGMTLTWFWFRTFLPRC